MYPSFCLSIPPEVKAIKHLVREELCSFRSSQSWGNMLWFFSPLDFFAEMTTELQRKRHSCQERLRFPLVLPCEITRYPQGRVCYLGSTQCEYLITFHTVLLNAAQLSAAVGAARASVSVGGQNFICISGRNQSQAHIRCVSRGGINKELLCSSKSNSYLHTVFPSTGEECEEWRL